MGPWPFFFARGNILDAVFNQLVRSCAQLLVAAAREQAKKPGD
jgi:hypothetical protein